MMQLPHRPQPMSGGALGLGFLQFMPGGWTSVSPASVSRGMPAAPRKETYPWVRLLPRAKGNSREELREKPRQVPVAELGE